MEMPIISPSMVSYADELNFNKLLEDLLRNKHNGFIRVTFGSNEGYILFKNGNQIAASYYRYSKLLKGLSLLYKKMIHLLKFLI